MRGERLSQLVVVVVVVVVMTSSGGHTAERGGESSGKWTGGKELRSRLRDGRLSCDFISASGGEESRESREDK